MGIMMYLPGYSGSDREEVVRRGLADLLEPTVDVIPTPVVKGPDGKAGTLFTFFPGHSPREVDVNTQEWLEAPPDGELDGGRYWLGYVKGRKPTPEQLQRRDLIDGEAVVLADDKVWVVPCCNKAPKRFTRDRAGREVEVVKDQHKRWVEWSNELFGVIINQGYGTLGDPDYIIQIPGGIRYAALALGKNYRVNADVLDLLELIDERVVSDLVLAATGITALARLIAQKKSTDTPSLQETTS